MIERICEVKKGTQIYIIYEFKTIETNYLNRKLFRLFPM